MPDIQEFIALGIVALVAGRLLWRRWARRVAQGKPGGQSSDCGDCPSSGPPPKEATMHFYRRRENAKSPASGAPTKPT